VRVIAADSGKGESCAGAGAGADSCEVIT